MKHEKSCGAIRYGGHWAFPKGHVEAGESEEETAMREVREETGAQVRVRPGYREVTTYSPAKGVTKDVVFFVAEITGGTYFHAADADGIDVIHAFPSSCDRFCKKQKSSFEKHILSPKMRKVKGRKCELSVTFAYLTNPYTWYKLYKYENFQGWI